MGSFKEINITIGAAMAPPTLENVFLGQDSLYFQSITKMKFNSVMTTALTIYNINNLPTMESLALPRDLYWDGKFKPTSPPSSELFSIYDELNGSWISGENFANDNTIISNDNIELKHGMDLTEELLGNDEKLVAEFYDMPEDLSSIHLLHTMKVDKLII
uniref:Uncharacterized protein n=1 Tax=Glossina palpalis gambiensis TaxID=67801 RepID=A0A1B0BX03_9MUSC